MERLDSLAAAESPEDFARVLDNDIDLEQLKSFQDQEGRNVLLRVAEAGHANVLEYLISTYQFKPLDQFKDSEGTRSCF